MTNSIYTKMKMKSVLTILMIAFMVVPAFTQELSKKEQKQLEKELKNEQKAEEAAQKAEIVDVMVHYQRFVLEAHTLRDKRGSSVNVSSTLNFIASDSISGVIQVGSNSYIGSNGVGGVTVSGSISEYKYSIHEKSGSYNVSYYLRTPVGSYDVRLTVYPDGRADADVTSTTWGDKLRYSGYLVPTALSKVYKGSSL